MVIIVFLEVKIINMVVQLIKMDNVKDFLLMEVFAKHIIIKPIIIKHNTHADI